MEEKKLNRRQAIERSIAVVAGSSLPALASNSALAQQLPPPVPLQDDRVTFISTTEAAAWQTGALFKPTFEWDILDLAVSPAS